MSKSRKSRARKTPRSARASSRPVLRPGPRKTRKTGPPAARLSRHKARAAWFRSRVTWPLREASAAKLTTERRRATRQLKAARIASAWTQAGPTNIGGRCTSLVCHPTDANRLWIGAAGGGVWTTRDAGETWTLKWRSGAPLEIGSLAIDPSNPKVLYCGTGEANLSADSYPGDGLYRSTNGGRSWKPFATSAASGLPRRIGAIAVDPFDPRHILVGGIGYGRVSDDNDFGGLHSTSDAGATWARETFISANNYWCHSIAFDPLHAGTVFATFTGPGAKSGIYRSKNGGATWTQLTSGLPSTDRIGRTTVALAPSDPSIVYALSAEMASDGADRVLGVFRSTNGGSSWTDIAGSHFADEGQMSYGNAIAVDPLDPNHVICGGVDLHVTTNAGAMWRVSSHWDADRGTPTYAHADHHALVFAPSRPGRVYTANDGGLDVSDDGGKTWTNRSRGLAVTMFYDVDVAQTDAAEFGGGAQDNGTLVTSTGKADEFFELLGGDGGWMVVDPNDAGHVYACTQSWRDVSLPKWNARSVSLPFASAESAGIWMVYITIDHDSDTVYTGNQRLYRTTNDGGVVGRPHAQVDESDFGHRSGARRRVAHLCRHRERGLLPQRGRRSHGSANLADSTLPGVMITRIDTHPEDAADVFITVANFGNLIVFRSKNGGSTWNDIDNGDCRTSRITRCSFVRTHRRSSTSAATRASSRRDGGRTWRNATANLPNVMVVDLSTTSPRRRSWRHLRTETPTRSLA
ncbi:MAG: hypothetical protein U0Q12_02970 [Vicinamibacterales bacterium]